MKEANHWYLLWMLGWLVSRPAAQLMMRDDRIVLTSFTAFCSYLTFSKKASRIGYFPESPTKPPVLREIMSRLVTVSRSLGHKWTIIAGDQATYGLATVIRSKHKMNFVRLFFNWWISSST